MTHTVWHAQILRLFLVMFVLFAFLLAVSPPPVVYAATITVNDVSGGTGAPGCKLRDAITAANTNAVTGGCPAGNVGGTDIIELPAGAIITLNAVDNGAGVEANGLPIIQSDITINGHGATVQRSSVGGTPNFRIFKIMGYQTVTLNDLTISNGRCADGSGVRGGEGGAIQNNNAFVTLSHVTITGNRTGDGSSGGNGGAILNASGELTVTNNSTISGNSTGSGTAGGSGAGIYNNYRLVVQNSTISGNSTGSGTAGKGGSGGGIYNYMGSMNLTGVTISNNTTGNGTTTGGFGGGIHNDLGVTANVISSTISGNRTGDGGSSFGGYGGGINHEGNITLTITSSAITGNTTGNSSSSLGGAGGGVYDAGGPLAISNSTISGNTTGTPTSHAGGIYSDGPLQVTSSTIANNTAVWMGGGIVVNTSGTVTNTIVANNTPAATNCVGTVTNGGNNLDSGTSCGWGAAKGSLSSVDPMLGALASNGGSTQTMALQIGSPAIDGVTYSAPNGSPSADQRGLTRPKGARHDIGAYEANFIPVTDTSGGTGSSGGCKLRDAITAANSDMPTGGCVTGFGPDIILLPAGATITLNAVDNGSGIDTNGLPNVTTDIAINGNNSIIERSSAGGTPMFRIVSVYPAGTLTLNNVTLRNGRTADGMPGAPGGAGGAIFNAGKLNVMNSTLSGNRTGSGLNNVGGAGGAIYSSGGSGVNLTNCTISGNITGGGTGGGLGAGIYCTDSLSITNCTIAGNTTGTPNGFGGGLVTGSNPVTVTNSTIANNTATQVGGGIRNGGGTITLRNTIVANNTAPVNANCDNGVTNDGNNIDSGDSCSLLSNKGSMSNTDPKLLPLANNGGPTQTMALGAGSPAIDGVTYNAPNASPSTDQRGYARPYGPRHDIGAFEVYPIYDYLPYIIKH